ncbi:hypothetical protein BFINE_31140 [Bacteroides finegoldii DSM 17565]|nr:hypothetical protein BFINE_31140 [Bacteroides finegoldii DSM 17565]
MLTKIEKGHEDFDVVCPSEYIIERMLKKHLLLPIDTNFAHSPNYMQNVAPFIREQINKLSQPERKRAVMRYVICGEQQESCITVHIFPIRSQPHGSVFGIGSMPEKY